MITAINSKDQAIITSTERPLAWSVAKGLLLALALLFVILIALRDIGAGEFYANVDETYHACDGVFLARVIHDFPIADPMGYARLYYAQYPALNLGTYPPLFYLAEAGVFLLVGPSAVSARLTVLVFMLVGAYFWFKLMSVLLNEWAALASTALLVSLPGILLYEQSAMLEVPTLSLCVVATYFWVQYVRLRKPRMLSKCALFTALAMLTKHHAIYLLPFFVLTAISSRTEHPWNLREFIKAISIFLVLTVPIYGVMYLLQGDSIQAIAAARTANFGSHWQFYLNALPENLGRPVLGLSVLGMITGRWWADRKMASVMVVWILSSYFLFNLFPHQEARYAIYWLPPFLYFAVGLAANAHKFNIPRLIPAAILAVLVTVYLGRAALYERPFVSGYEAAARHLIESKSSGMVLTDVDLAGNLIFFMSSRDSERRFTIMRKALYADRFVEGLGHEELIDSTNELREMISAFGVRNVLVESNMPLKYKSQRVLREVVNSKDFRLVATFPIETNVPSLRGRTLLLYENLEAKVPTASFYRVRMMTMANDIVVPMMRLTR